MERKVYVPAPPEITTVHAQSMSQHLPWKSVVCSFRNNAPLKIAWEPTPFFTDALSDGHGWYTMPEKAESWQSLAILSPLSW